MMNELTPEQRLRAAGATLISVIPGGLVDDPAGGKPWPSPLPIKTALPAVAKMRADMLPSALRSYIFDVAECQQSPVDFVAVTAIVAASAVIGNRYRIAPKANDDWTVVPNLWGAVIGPPSAMKSPAMQSALGALYSLQDAARKTWEADVKESKVDAKLSDLSRGQAAVEAKKRVKAGDRDAAREILANAGGDVAEEPSCPRYIVNDATVEKLGELLNENPRGLLLVRDELPGWLARMESEECQSERAFYLEAFNGDGRFVYDRIGRGTVHIESATLSIIGGIQPARIAPIVRGALNGASNDGLIQRLQLAVWPDGNRDWEYVDRHSHKDAREAYERVFSDLDRLFGSSEVPVVLRFSPSAQEVFKSWLTAINLEARSGTLASTLESHILKMPKTAASLALIFELIDGGRMEVGEASLMRAIAWGDYLRTHASRLYAAGSTMADDGAKLIVERRAQLPAQFTIRDVQRKMWAGLADRETVAAAIDVLESSNHCRELPPPPSTSGRPSGPAYIWNPVLDR